MIQRIIDFSAHNRFLVLALVFVVARFSASTP